MTRGAGVLVAIAMGGALGTGARAAISMVGMQILEENAYLATLLVNVLGAALIGYLATRALEPRAQALWMTGFCGGFTTFSLFSLEILLLLERDLVLAFAYGAGSLGLWLVGVWAGYRFGRARP
ncbi:fluoride efflux transporter FluC [Roseinatronobacter monicus]|uniref:Fluoride-specific ion channel FluC n=1 Tax=Roseinatronobacter monicus TaxID=393481 RepID=A0A543KED8_9RHOB|nr:CrcB family protein [Roseinatronobacter monicus]TQM93445.1 camphor resistance protein CrcB [Roseinatronobacter monicus]